MARIPVLTILLQLCTLILVLGQNSPCSEYYRLVSNSSTTSLEKYGVINIRAPKNTSELRLNVTLSMDTQQEQSDFQLELAQSDTEVTRAIQQGKTLWYRVYFPKKIPLVTGIWLNGQKYCTTRWYGAYPVVTIITLDHLYVPYTPSDNDDCGHNNNVVENANRNVNPLISKGVKISSGQWPWLVAIFVTKSEIKFQCAGNILTTRHILTAAHCCKSNNNINISPSEMLVSLGRYRLLDWNETGSVNREIESYVLHPEYTHQISGDSDLAIFTLKDPVEFSPTIKPICLWSGSSDLGDVINTSGYVVGWGRDEHGNPYVEEPRMARAPVVSLSDCHWSDSRFVAFTSNRTFCAGLRDGSGPCFGDSGSGLMFYNSTTGSYHLRGIVSRSLFNHDEESCDLSQYLVYVDVTKYKEWIEQQIFNV